MTKQEIGVRVQRVPGTSRIWTRAHSTTASAISIAKATSSGMIGSMSPGYLASAANRVRASLDELVSDARVSGGTSKVTNECSDSMRPRPELSPVSAGRSLFASFD